MFCNVKDDIEKVTEFRKQMGYKKSDDLNEDLKACVFMEAASFIGFWNVLLGYYMAKSMKDAMCKMCLSDTATFPNAAAHLDAVRDEVHKDRTSLTKKEKATVCFFLQYVTSLSNMGCPTGLTETAAKPSSKNPLASLMPQMRPPFYGMNMCNPCGPPC
jgi:hypothetical protein